MTLGVRRHLSEAGDRIVGGRSYRADDSRRRQSMLIDCDTCTARGTGCADCVVTVLLGAPPGWQSVDPVVVPMTGRARTGVPEGRTDASVEAVAEDGVVPPAGVVVEFDEVERRAARALVDVGLVPPLRDGGALGEDARDDA